MSLHVTGHAISRYRERVAAVSYDAAVAALTSPVISMAAEIGAPFVKLGTGQRVVLCGDRVVTVLLKDHWIGALAPGRDAIHGRNWKESK